MASDDEVEYVEGEEGEEEEEQAEQPSSFSTKRARLAKLHTSLPLTAAQVKQLTRVMTCTKPKQQQLTKQELESALELFEACAAQCQSLLATSVMDTRALDRYKRHWTKKLRAEYRSATAEEVSKFVDAVAASLAYAPKLVKYEEPGRYRPTEIYLISFETSEKKQKQKAAEQQKILVAKRDEDHGDCTYGSLPVWSA